MVKIRLIPREEFERVRQSAMDKYEQLALLADMCRANALATVKRAGSGHLGSSFSSLDIVTALYYSELNVTTLGIDHSDRDIYFSSKGHDAPGFYAVLFSLGILARDSFVNLRRLGGTLGHPDVGTAGVEANSGSLGMGISKARGIALAKRMKGHGGRVFVMTGDGELQEGQIWESLQTTAHQGINNVCVIVDANKIQTDMPVADITDLGDLAQKFALFGWHVEQCDGHDFAALEQAFQKINAIADQPRILLADTVKGKGVSFMEGPAALKSGGGLYRWHSGAPDDESFEAAHEEIITRTNERLAQNGLAPVETEVLESRERNRARLKDRAEKVVTAFGEALVQLGAERKDLVVLDADLSADCGLRAFERTYPERFIQNGIAEQDMVSMAGGLALQGMLPVVNSFGVFLAARANEQIYNNATEITKVIYVCHYAGLIPAGPGKSHQSLRDISLFGALPNCVILEPCNGQETKMALEWCVNQAQTNCMMRLVISPSPRTITLPSGYRLTSGQGAVLNPGRDAVLFGYGPVMLHEALVASEILQAEEALSLKIVNLPWLNRIHPQWLAETVGDCHSLFALDNHAGYGGLGDALLNALAQNDALRGRRLVKFAVDGHAACGTPQEALSHHRMDGRSLAKRILQVLKTEGSVRR